MPDSKEQIIYVSSNPGKIASARHALAPFGIEVIQQQLDIIEPQFDSIEAIVASKVKQAFAQVGQRCIAQDGGFEIECWDGFPGPETEFVNRKIKNAGFLKLMKGESNRKCRFVRCVAYLGPEVDVPVFFHSYNPGTMARKERGKMDGSWHWSPLSMIFIPEGCKKTLAEMTEDEYRKIVSSTPEGSGEVQFGQWFREHRR